MKRLMLILALALSLHSLGHTTTCAEAVKKFYTEYLTNWVNDGFNQDNNQALREKYFTKELLTEIEREYDYDLLTRTQDCPKAVPKSIEVKDLGGDWYMLSYDFYEGWNFQIPIKAKLIDGQCKLMYITTYINGLQYGDELLQCGEPHKAIDQSSPSAFVESFYKAYVTPYCTMSLDLMPELKALRQTNLSAAALEQFKKADDEALADGFIGFDFLINGFDFDSFWYHTIRVEPLDDNVYKISYDAGFNTRSMIATIKQEAGRYVIDKITWEKHY